MKKCLFVELEHSLPTFPAQLPCKSRVNVFAHFTPYPPHLHHEAEKGYGHSMIFLAYFLTTLSSPKMKRDLLTVKQFSLTGMGLYKAMVRARCALVCLKAGEMPPVDTAAPSRFRLRSDPPSPELNKPGTSSPKRAILSEAKPHGRRDSVRQETEKEIIVSQKAGRGAALGVTAAEWRDPDQL